MCRQAIGLDPDRSRRLAGNDHGVLTVGQLTALEAEAGVMSGEPRGVCERGGPPLLVDDQQKSHLREGFRARREGSQDAERKRDAALHVDRPRSTEQRRPRGASGDAPVGDHRVEVTEQEQLSLAGSAQMGQQVFSVIGG